MSNEILKTICPECGNTCYVQNDCLMFCCPKCNLIAKTNDNLTTQLYHATLKHDNGKTKIVVLATSIDSAKEKIINAENCPDSAILKIISNDKQIKKLTTMLNNLKK